MFYATLKPVFPANPLSAGLSGAFCCHFWSKYMPKLDYCQKKGEPAPMEQVEGERPRRKVLEAVRAIEMHMTLSCIAKCCLQHFGDSAEHFHPLYREGKFQPDPLPEDAIQGRVSEAALMHFFRKHFSAF